MNEQLDKVDGSRSRIELLLQKNQDRMDALVAQLESGKDHRALPDLSKVSYGIGRLGSLKLFLNLQHPGAMMHTLTYHRIVQKYQGATLDTLDSEVVTDIPKVNDDSAQFVEWRSTLHWPARGAVLHRFGVERGTNGLHCPEVVIGARPGDPVHAVSRGRLTFAGL